MKIACCQFNPKIGAVEKNMTVANELLKEYSQSRIIRYTPDDIDLLVLPEMAFTGYVFQDFDEIKPYLEDSETGQTVSWAKKQAQRLRSFVVVGYPQIEGDQCYNSLCCVDPQGEIVQTYRKTFLYDTDENWAAEGPGFVSVKIDKLGKVGFGICMDVNPYQFKADFNECEFAKYHLKQNTEIIVCCMAWLKSGTGESGLIEYWARRFLPLLNNLEEGKRVHFIACNRTGLEKGVVFAGTSCVLEFAKDCVTLVNVLQQESTGVLISEIE